MQEILSKKAIGERIKKLRVENGLSQSFLANILKLSRSNYSQIEIGNQFPSYQTLLAISKYFQKSYEWLLHGIGEHEVLIPIDLLKKTPELQQPTIVLNKDGYAATLFVKAEDTKKYAKLLNDEAFIGSLAPLEVPLQAGERYRRAFSVKNKVLPAPLLQNDLLIAEHVSTYAEVVVNNLYIIITKKELIVARLLSVALPFKTLFCALNENEASFEVNTDDVKELWEITGKYTSSLNPTATELEKNLKKVENALKALEQDLLRIKSIQLSKN
ncbi:helix-turn-helix domain-containing protein [Pedobacter sp. MC2016-14]|uniref:helix-turn-helix domain-containing protein n=1 Tax=Pedobacter sp. MC2016-14 TaxID=2897327 RepID=UPI001E556656|nr:helix-turn-helix transcriptional regulator [Pedobacter sp. MC2016-14]MCD0486968.1 helix-turn-helix domain-containing protein [Pedobacter sp. MC2016-14]